MAEAYLFAFAMMGVFGWLLWHLVFGKSAMKEFSAYPIHYILVFGATLCLFLFIASLLIRPLGEVNVGPIPFYIFSFVVAMILLILTNIFKGAD